MPVLRNSSVQITLKGMFLLYFEANKQSCQACVINIPDHRFRISVKQKDVIGQPHVIFSKEVTSGSIHVEFPTRSSDGRNAGVSQFQNNDIEFIRDVSNNDINDFRWVVDLEGAEFRNQSGQISIKSNILKQAVYIHHGQFFTEERMPVSVIAREHSNPLTLIAESIGCSINLEEGETVRLRDDEDNELIKFAVGSVLTNRFEVLIENHCDDVPSTGQSRGDFSHYYDLLDAPHEDQIVVKGVLFSADPDKNRQDPCGPAYASLTPAPILIE